MAKLLLIGAGGFLGAIALHEAIVARAKEAGLAGATVLRGLLGYGARSRVHSAHILRLAEDLPLVIEIVDRETSIREFLPKLDEMVTEGMVTLERVEILMYRDGGKPKP